MKNYCTLALLLILQTTYLRPFNENDGSNLVYNIFKVTVIGIGALAIPRYINNPPQSNVKEFIRSKIFNENAKIEDEINELRLRLEQIKKDIEGCEDYPTKCRLKEEKSTIKEKISQLETSKNTYVPLIKHSAHQNPSKEEIVEQNSIQEQLLTIPLNKTTN